MAEAETIVVETPNLRLVGLAWGPEDGRPVVALHGWLDNAATWEHVAPRLEGVRLVAMDAPGHGRSQHRTEAPYHFIDYVAETLHGLDALADRFGAAFERPVLMGHSMGAGIMSLVAGVRPDRVRGVILVEGLGPLSEPPHLAVKRLAKAVRSERRQAERRAAGDPKTVHASLDAAAARVAEAAVMELDSARTLVRRGLRRVDDGWVWAADSRLRIHSRQYLTEESVRAYLEAVTAPTLLIKAERGWPFDWENIRARADAMGTDAQPVEIVELPGGHHLHLDAPDLVAPVLQRFVDGLAG